MSSLDHVFIKAYGKGALSHAADRTPTVAPPPPPVTPVRHDPPVGMMPSESTGNEYMPLSDWAARPQTISGPHWHLKPKDATTNPETLMPSAAVPPPATPQRDTSALVASFEVARFQWPGRVSQITMAAANGFSNLALLIAQRSREGRKVLAITSTHRGEGRSTLALAVARTIGNRNIRVALVDADFHAPQLSEALQLAIEVGWEDVLAGDQPLREALVESVADRVTLLPLRSALPEPAVNDRHLVAETIEQLRRHFDLVVVDLGPLGDDTSAIDFAAIFHEARLDDALVIRDVHRATPDDLKRVGRRLSAAGIRHWDVVENFVAN